MNVLVWFKRDLRIHDHPALTLAAEIGAVLPVFVVEPDRWSQPDASARQWEFVAESLAGLREDLAGIGAPLVVRVGDAVQVLAGLCRRHGIARMTSHAEPGTAWSKARDLRVADWAKAAGVVWTELAEGGEGCCSPGQNSGRAAAAAPALPAPMLRAVAGVEPGLIPSARSLRLSANPCPHRQLGGRARGVELLEGFLTRRGESYATTGCAPLASERASSRLSPHLAHGTLSLREVAEATAARQDEKPGGRWRGALARFQASLAARQVAVAAWQPEAEESPAAIPGFHPGGSDATRLAALMTGETGLPFFDACLRYLRATGWLDTRLRAMLVAVGYGPLGVDATVVGAHLARLFTDHDPALHWPQVQVATVGASRLWNPVRLGRRLDPTGAFTRRWLPELAEVPEDALQEPWRWSGAQHLLGHRYPEPVIDLSSAIRMAQARARQSRNPAGVRQAPRGSASERACRRREHGAQLCLPF